jgi:hypothetical protein
MIIAVSVCLVSAVFVAMSQAKKEKVEEDLNTALDFNMGLQEENRVLDTCLVTMETQLNENKFYVSVLESSEKQLFDDFQEEKNRVVKFWQKKAEDERVARVKLLQEADEWNKKADELDRAKEETERLRKSMDFVVYERDLHKAIRSQNWDERNAYKRLYEAELTKKAPQ